MNNSGVTKVKDSYEEYGKQCCTTTSDGRRKDKVVTGAKTDDVTHRKTPAQGRRAQSRYGHVDTHTLSFRVQIMNRVCLAKQYLYRGFNVLSVYQFYETISDSHKVW